jgi:hypothetical protein
MRAVWKRLSYVKFFLLGGARRTSRSVFALKALMARVATMVIATNIGSLGVI